MSRLSAVALLAVALGPSACGDGDHAAGRPIPLATRIPPRVKSTCEQAGHATRMPLVCPPLVPAGGVVADHGLYGSDARAGFYLLTFNNGENRGYVHWIAGAGLGNSAQRNLFNPRFWDAPGRFRRLGAHRYGPWTITFFRFPPHPSGGPLGGHDLALAKVGATTYFATVHGYDHHDTDAAMLIAILLRSPGGR